MKRIRLALTILCLTIAGGLGLPVFAESNLGGTVEYTIVYDTTGGVSGPETATVLGNETYAVVKVNNLTPTRDGFSFSGWALDPASDKTIMPGAYFTATNRVTTLYAVWAPISSVPTVSDVKTEPLGEFTNSLVERYEAHMFSTPAMIAMIIGVPILLAMMVGGGIVIYRTIKQ